MDMEQFLNTLWNVMLNGSLEAISSLTLSDQPYTHAKALESRWV